MGFYNMSKSDRLKLVESLNREIRDALIYGKSDIIENYFGDSDTYIRKNAYEAVAKVYLGDDGIHDIIVKKLTVLLKNDTIKVRQSAVHALGEIGRLDSSKIMAMLEQSLADESKIVQNAVIGSLKRMGEKNPLPTLEFARTFLHHPDPAIRREIVHGIELRGRTHPEEIVPMLGELQDEKNAKVKKMIVHVVAQCSYKKGCLEKVLDMLKEWHNKEIVVRILHEIIEVHGRYSNFSEKSVEQTIQLVRERFPHELNNGL